MRELSMVEVDDVSGGFINVPTLGTGLAMIGLGVTIVATGGIALVGATAAITIGQAVLAGTGIALSGGGGFLVGAGLTGQSMGAPTGGTGSSSSGNGDGGGSY